MIPINKLAIEKAIKFSSKIFEFNYIWMSVVDGLNACTLLCCINAWKHKSFKGSKCLEGLKNIYIKILYKIALLRISLNWSEK